jgi:hypothetical protein
MKKSLKKLGLAGMLFGATALGVGGCASFYEDPMFRALYGTPQELLPEFIQSGGYREYKRNEAREEYEKKRVEEEREGEGTIWETIEIYDVTTDEKIASLKGRVREDYEKFARSFRNYLKLEPNKTYRLDRYWSNSYEINGKLDGEKKKSVLIKLEE